MEILEKPDLKTFPADFAASQPPAPSAPADEKEEAKVSTRHGVLLGSTFTVLSAHLPMQTLHARSRSHSAHSCHSLAGSGGITLRVGKEGVAEGWELTGTLAHSVTGQVCQPASPSPPRNHTLLWPFASAKPSGPSSWPPGGPSCRTAQGARVPPPPVSTDAMPLPGRVPQHPRLRIGMARCSHPVGPSQRKGSKGVLACASQGWGYVPHPPKWAHRAYTPVPAPWAMRRRI